MGNALLIRKSGNEEEITHHYNSATVENDTKYRYWFFGATQGGGSFTLTGATYISSAQEDYKSGATWNDTYWHYRYGELLTTSTTLKLSVSGGTGTIFLLQKI